MQKLMVYSEAGGVTKTATAISLAMVSALSGHRTLLVDLDPRAASTKWLDVEPSEPGLDVGAILADSDPTGWAEDLAVKSAWHDNLSCVPSARSVANRESDGNEFADLRLSAALDSTPYDTVIIDCPNRQGGPLTRNALNAADGVIYAAIANAGGLDGYEGAAHTVNVWRRYRQQIGAPNTLQELGVVVGAVREVVMSRTTRWALDTLRESDMLITPIIPHRVIVEESQAAGRWYGEFTAGRPVVDAYTEIGRKVFR